MSESLPNTCASFATVVVFMIGHDGDAEEERNREAMLKVVILRDENAASVVQLFL